MVCCVQLLGQSYLNIVAGACFAMALKHVGSSDKLVGEAIESFIDEVASMKQAHVNIVRSSW